MKKNNIPKEIFLKDCPGPDTMIDYVDGILPKDKVKQIKKHLTKCIVCRDVTRDHVRIVKEVEDEFKKKKKQKNKR